MTRSSPSKPRAPARRRAPGRPAGKAKRAGGSDPRAQLLDAAIACFVRTGIAATTLREIAREARVTPALLNYYFGDKAKLQAALVEERLMPMLALLREPLQQAGDDVGASIAAFVGGITRLAAEHPWLPPLWVREVRCEGGALRDVLFERVGPVVPRMMAARFAAAQARGELNDDLDPRLLMVSLVGLTLFPIAGAPIWRRLFEDGAPGEAGRAPDFDGLRRHTLALLGHGIGTA